MLKLNRYVLLAACSLFFFANTGCGRREKSAISTVTPPRSEATSVPKFVGVETCVKCHAVNYGFHQMSGHAHTLRSATLPEVQSKFVGKTFDRVGYGSFQYEFEASGLAAKLPDAFSDRVFPLDYAFGSGQNAITLLTLLSDDNGKTVGIEHCGSWFASLKGLSLTPGHAETQPTREAEYFGKWHEYDEVSKCFGCHTTTGIVALDKPELTDIVPNVNCERCHGAASEHVKLATNSPPPPFSVGRPDWSRSDEIDLCGGCHRMPSDFSAQKLRDYPAVMARFQPVGMLRSKCYIESDEVRCTTCHNPHQGAKVRTVKSYEKICLSCHQQQAEKQVSCPKSPSDGCIDCHMPLVPLIKGIAFHDHWVRVH